ncbi:hypothetical protein PT169_03655 [Erysipelothrix rhusiopathiae]|nr:hypothetical protein [Erysipelothrix rhusiopathiae]
MATSSFNETVKITKTSAKSLEQIITRQPIKPDFGKSRKIKQVEKADIKTLFGIK